MCIVTEEGISMVDLDMTSALDRLMDDVAGAGLSSAATRTQRPSIERTVVGRRIERAGNGLSRTASGSIIPLHIPPKDARRKREEIFIEKGTVGGGEFGVCYTSGVGCGDWGSACRVNEIN
jgi:hypothetical protein